MCFWYEYARRDYPTVGSFPFGNHSFRFYIPDFRVPMFSPENRRISTSCHESFPVWGKAKATNCSRSSPHGGLKFARFHIPQLNIAICTRRQCHAVRRKGNTYFASTGSCQCNFFLPSGCVPQLHITMAVSRGQGSAIRRNSHCNQIALVASQCGFQLAGSHVP